MGGTDSWLQRCSGLGTRLASGGVAQAAAVATSSCSCTGHAHPQRPARLHAAAQGYNITVGANFYANFNTTILDCARVTIGDRCADCAARQQGLSTAAAAGASSVAPQLGCAACTPRYNTTPPASLTRAGSCLAPMCPSTR